MSGMPPPPPSNPGVPSGPAPVGTETLPKQTLRGVVGIVIRAGEQIGAYAVNAALRRLYPGRYKPATASDVSVIERELKAGPYPTAGMVQFGFEYWYNYFFKELPDLRKPAFAGYVLNDDGSFRTETTPPARPWKAIFDEMLSLGFKAFTTADHITAEAALIHAATEGADSERSVLQRLGVKVLFRGDGRLPEMIRQQRGTARQSRVDVLRAQRSMTSDWHPFSQMGHKIWVRSGYNGDNCLFSAVSITPQFEVATKFPLLDDLRGSNPGAIGHSLVRIRPLGGGMPTPIRGPSVGQRYQSALQTGNDTTESRALLASQTNVYCVRMRDVYNTQNYQTESAFPEYATTRISWMDHILWFGVTRIHFSETDGNAGHLIVITGHRWLQEESIISGVLLGGPSLAELRTFTNDIVRRGSLVNGVGGITYVPPGVNPPFEVVSIRELFVPGRPPPSTPTLRTGPTPQPLPGRISIPTAFTQPR